MGNDSDGPVIAEYLGSASETEEFVDRWRTPGSPRPRRWEDRFGETVYVPMAERAWNSALKTCELSPGEVDVAVVTGNHARAVRAAAGRLGAKSVADKPNFSSKSQSKSRRHRHCAAGPASFPWRRR